MENSNASSSNVERESGRRGRSHRDRHVETWFALTAVVMRLG